MPAMSQPERIEPPSLEAFHFISRVFHEAPGYLDGFAHQQHCNPYQFEDDDFCKDHFYAAKEVGPAQLAPLAALSDETAARLFSIIGVIIRDTLIETKADLANIAIQEIDEPEDEYDIEGCSLDQLQIFLLHHAKQDMNPHWIELAEFYNTLAQDQQHAVSQFFISILNRPLDELLAVPGPEQALPAVISQELETHTQDGKHYAFCPIDQHWFRDADLNEKFVITGTATPLVNRNLLIATASTLKEAVARTSLYITGMSSDDAIRAVEIRYMGQALASANVGSKNFWSMPVPHIELPAKLIWDRENAGTDKITNQQFFDALIQTEKLLGLQWSKVQKLEDELGL
jgi:hypothetical protein